MNNQITQTLQNRINNGHFVELNLLNKQATIIYKDNIATPFVIEISSDDMLRLIFENSQYLNFNREICIIKKKEKTKEHEKVA